jgi:hypothetical protein
MIQFKELLATTFASLAQTFEPFALGSFHRKGCKGSRKGPKNKPHQYRLLYSSILHPSSFILQPPQQAKSSSFRRWKSSGGI